MRPGVPVVFATILCALLAFQFPRHTRITPEDEELRLMLHLRAGLRVDQALMALDSLGIEHSVLDAVSREVRGIDRKTATHGLLTWDNIRVHIYFDANYNIASHRIEVYRAGPWTRERCNGTSCTGFLE